MPEPVQTDVFTIFVHSWIIGVETKLYMFFPLIVFLLIESDTWRLAATALTAAGLIAQGSFTAHAYHGQRSYGAYLLHLLAIHLGYVAFGSTTVAGGVLTTPYARHDDPGGGIAISDRRAPRLGNCAASDRA